MRPRGRQDRQLARRRRDDLAGHADVVAEVDDRARTASGRRRRRCPRPASPAGRRCRVAQGREADAAVVADQHDAPGDRHRRRRCGASGGQVAGSARGPPQAWSCARSPTGYGSTPRAAQPLVACRGAPAPARAARRGGGQLRAGRVGVLRGGRPRSPAARGCWPRRRPAMPTAGVPRRLRRGIRGTGRSPRRCRRRGRRARGRARSAKHRNRGIHSGWYFAFDRYSDSSCHHFEPIISSRPPEPQDGPGADPRALLEDRCGTRRSSARSAPRRARGASRRERGHHELDDAVVGVAVAAHQVQRQAVGCPRARRTAARAAGRPPSRASTRTQSPSAGSPSRPRAIEKPRSVVGVAPGVGAGR